MSQDALDRRARTRLSKAEKRQYAKMLAEREERRSLADPRIVKKQSIQFRKIVEAQLKAAGVKK